MTRDTLFQYAFDTYSVEPDYPWMETPEAGVLRHPDTRKWFGLVMRVPARCIGHPSEDLIDILNVKADPMFISVVVGHDGFYRAYHMNKEHWMTIALAEASDETIRMALDQSYEMTERKRK